MSTYIERRSRGKGRHLLRVALSAAVLLAALIVVACTPIDAPSQDIDTTIGTSTDATPEPLNDLDLANATYRGIYSEPVQLQGGVYEGEPFAEGGITRPQVFLGDQRADGDLDDDGDVDSVVILSENSGGTGHFIYLAAVLNDNGSPVNAATVLLGDRVGIEQMDVVGNEIYLELLVHGPTDPMCCPTKSINQTWTFTGDELSLTQGITADEARADVGETMQFNGITFNYESTLATGWNVEEISDNRPTEAAPPDPSVGPTRIVFTPEGFPTASLDTVPPAIYVYRVSDLAQSPEEAVADQLADLIREQPDPSTLDALPLLPHFGAAQILHANAAYLSFDGGDGIGVRYVTYYAQDVAPLLGDWFWYTFQGLTNDGSIYVAAVFPISTELFPATLPEPFNYDAFAADFESYLIESVATLDNAPANAFTPYLSQLDALMRSFVVDDMAE